jgi:hypothetical protein
VKSGSTYTETVLKNEVSAELRRRFPLDALPPSAPVEELFAAAARARPEALESFRILAELPLPLYLSTTPDNLLSYALQAVNPSRSPRLEYVRWNPEVRWPVPLEQSQPDYEPSPESPLVYQLFDSLRLKKSTVISEDDYFDYLLSVTRKDRSHPLVVNRRLERFRF